MEDDLTLTYQSFIENSILDKVECRFVVITSLADGAFTGKYEDGCCVTEEEMRVIKERMESNPEEFKDTGIVLANEHYRCEKARDYEIVGKNGQSLVIVSKSYHSLVAASGKEGVKHIDVCTAVESLVTYLKSVNM